jgi:thiol-disulfide isomerase/thioredoxin
MNRNCIPLAIVMLYAAASHGAAAPQVGDQAPAIKVAKWVGGRAPVLPGQPEAEKHIFLIEFWATWCRPCLESIPHLAGLHRKHEKDGLVVIGLSNEEHQTIEEFIAKKKKQKMPYYVASYDEMSTTAAWTEDIPSIPHSFLVDRTGTVVWQGNPLAEAKAMDQAIADLLAGKFDLPAAKLAAITARKFNKLMSELQPAYVARDKEKVFQLLDQMIDLRPDELQPYLIKWQLLREFDMADQLEAWDAKIMKAFEGSVSAMRQLAEVELGQDYADRNPEMLLGYAVRANELAKGQDAEALSLLARVQCELGMIEAAITSQTKAADLAPDRMSEYYGKVLKYYQAVRKLAQKQPRGETGDKS